MTASLVAGLLVLFAVATYVLLCAWAYLQVKFGERSWEDVDVAWFGPGGGAEDGSSSWEVRLYWNPTEWMLGLRWEPFERTAGLTGGHATMLLFHVPLLALGTSWWWARRCRSCGCTDAHACPGGCSWVEADLCSACTPATSTPGPPSGP